MWFRNFALILSHPGSTSGQLCDALSSDRFLHVPFPGILDHPDKVQAVVGVPHRVQHAGAVYGVELLLNYQLTCRRLVEFSRSIYVLSDPRRAVPRMVESGLYDEESAVRLYAFRLRRLAELAKASKKGLLVTEADLEKPEGVCLVADFLRTRTQPQPIQGRRSCIELSSRLLGSAVESYERHLFYMLGLPLRRLE